MTDLSSRPPRAAAPFVVSQNPFYLLSAACMLLGCLMLTNSLSWSPIRIQRLLTLIVTLNLYEILMIGLAAFLVSKRIVRDASMLLVVEAFFLIDVTFLNAEIFAADFVSGVWTNALLLALTVLKLLAIFRMLRWPVAHPAFAILVLQMMVLFAFAGWFKKVSDFHEGRVHILTLYAAWWMIAILMVPAATIIGKLRSMATTIEQHRGLLITLLVLPIVSMIAHVGTSHWVYKTPFTLSHIAPLILGIAVSIGVIDTHVTTITARLRIQFLLPVLALLLSVWFPHSMQFNLSFHAMSPWRCATFGVICVYLHGFFVHGQIQFFMAACLLFFAYTMGATTQIILDNLMKVLRLGSAVAEKTTPTSSGDWGVLAVIASFVFLVVGAIVSLKKSARQVEALAPSAGEEEVLNKAGLHSIRELTPPS